MGNVGYPVPETFLPELSYIFSVEQYGSAGNVVKPQRQLCYGGFSASRASDYSCCASLFTSESNSVKGILVSVGNAEADIVESDHVFPMAVLCLIFRLRIVYFRLFLKDLSYPFNAYKGSGKRYHNHLRHNKIKQNKNGILA